MQHGATEMQAALHAMRKAALNAADPRLVLPPTLPPPPKGRVVVVGAGKAAALMAQVVNEAWAEIPLTGVVVTRYGHAVPAGRIQVLQAGHPVPDANSLAASEAILTAVTGLTPDDLVLCLISGGGSALLAAPRPGLDLATKQEITRALLASGAPIAEINAVRRQLSRIKGGGLAAAVGPARLVTLAISDVPGDSPADIASGPTVPPPPAEDWRAILARYAITAPDLPPFTQPATPQGPRAFQLIATPGMALTAAAESARAQNLTPLILGDALEGEARELARTLAGIALSCHRTGQPARPPCVLLSGGETTVTLHGPAGRGGRNTEFLLALALHLQGHPAIHALAIDTDGIDGTEDAAGASIGPDTLSRARALGLDARGMLDRHDSYSFFARMADLIVTGPTLTNVNDFRAILIL